MAPDASTRSNLRITGRREFLAWVSASPLLGAAGLAGCAASRAAAGHEGDALAALQNLFQLEALARERMSAEAFAYLSGGADDMRTVRANETGYRSFGIRAHRRVDVRQVDTTVELFGTRLPSPILLAPVGFQALFHPEGERASARAAAVRGHRMIVSSVSSFSIGEIAAAAGTELWFQLYPTPNRTITRGLLQRAEQAGCTLVALTVDTPVIGNREGHGTSLARMLGGAARMGTFEGLIGDESVTDPGMTWDMVAWLRANTSMRIVLKGIVTAEDARRALERGVDGLIVSNHGGRQLESDRATIACLPEVVEAVEGRIPVLLDGGIRRGTDVFKALALGARAVCIGRPYCWGLAAAGSAGVERALDLLQAELVRDLQLAGTPSLAAITRDCVAPG